MQGPAFTQDFPASLQRSEQNAAILCRLKSGQLLSLAADAPAGLILFKSFYTDFVGPRAAVGSEFDRHCTAVYTIGAARFQIAATRAQREETLQTRIAYAEALANIINIPVPLRRSCLIVEVLRQWLSPELVESIAVELIAKLVSVPPVTLKLAWRSRREIDVDMTTLAV